MARICIVEDDEALRTEVAHLLELQGFETHLCLDFEHATHDILASDPDCVILDLKLPSSDINVDGYSICRDVRRESDVPIIVLTSVNNEFDEVISMGLGADDYVTKPYRPAVLLARINSLLRRSAAKSSETDGTSDDHMHSTLEKGDLSLDLDSSEASYEGKRAILTRNEQRILAILMRNAGTIISRQEIMCYLWESDTFVDDNTLTVNINRLRKTLASIGVPEDFITTRRSQGYIVLPSTGDEE